MSQDEIIPMKPIQATDTPETTDMMQMLHQQAKAIAEIRQILEQHGEMLKQVSEMTKLAKPNIEYISRTVGRLTPWERQRPERRETTPRPRHRTNQDSEHQATLEDNEISKQDAYLPEVLQEKISVFVNDIYINDRSLTDDLLENGCITSNECSELEMILSPGDKVRYLIRTIKRRPPQKIAKFVEILGKDYPHLRDDVEFSCSQKAKEKKLIGMCLYCKIKNTVDLRDIMDDLWRHKIINDDLYGSIIDCYSRFCNQSLFWELIFIQINTSSERAFAREILIKSLEDKYQHISNEIKSYQEASLICQCRTLNIQFLRPRPLRTDSISGSISDLSTTTDDPRVPRFERLESSSEPSSDVDDLSKSGNSTTYWDAAGRQSKWKADSNTPCHEFAELRHEARQSKWKADSNTPCHEFAELRHEANKQGTHELNCSKNISNDINQFNATVTSRSENEKLSRETKETKSAMVQVDLTDSESDNSSASSSERPRMLKSVSVITVIANTDSIDDIKPLQETQTFSDQTEEKMIKMEKNCNQELTHYQATNRKTKRRTNGGHLSTTHEIFEPWIQKYEAPAYSDEDMTESEESRRHQILQQRSVIGHADLKKTEPRPVIGAGMKLRVRDQTSRRNKSSRKRDSRRYRNPKPTDFLVPNQNRRSKIPYNTSWTKVPQEKDTIKWDYYQGRRWLKIIEKTKPSNVADDIHADEGVNDTDSPLTESATAAYSIVTI
ncbi:hypothetical protein CHS0354_033333 [Potamilus streckersoni]|uniref:CARD domain-containing protein n=1 Tax=Potamilus streckersoni TaxID=2493646 RepID=A0AAE0VIW1_9BIVA|nr:hypothetical protein CHS0354_033333 [Potamilus streckersoni]